MDTDDMDALSVSELILSDVLKLSREEAVSLHRNANKARAHFWHDPEIDMPMTSSPARFTHMTLEDFMGPPHDDSNVLCIFDSPPRSLALLDPYKKRGRRALIFDLPPDVFARVWPPERVIMAFSVSKNLSEKIIGNQDRNCEDPTVKNVSIQLGFSHFPTLQLLQSSRNQHVCMFWADGQARTIPWVSVTDSNGIRRGFDSPMSYVGTTLRRIQGMHKLVHIVGWGEQPCQTDFFRVPECLPQFNTDDLYRGSRICSEPGLRQFVTRCVREAVTRLAGGIEYGRQKGITELRITIRTSHDLLRCLCDLMPYYKDKANIFTMKTVRKLDIRLPIDARTEREGNNVRECIQTLRRLFQGIPHCIEELTLRLVTDLPDNEESWKPPQLELLMRDIGEFVVKLRYMRIQLPCLKTEGESGIDKMCIDMLSTGIESRRARVEHIRIERPWRAFADLRDCARAASRLAACCDRLDLFFPNGVAMLDGTYMLRVDRIVSSIVTKDQTPRELTLRLKHEAGDTEIDTTSSNTFGATRAICESRGVKLSFVETW